jgi:hypothetical protein
MKCGKCGGEYTHFSAHALGCNPDREKQIASLTAEVATLHGELEGQTKTIADLTSERDVLFNKLAGLRCGYCGGIMPTEPGFRHNCDRVTGLETQVTNLTAEWDRWKSAVQVIHDRAVILHHDDIAKFCREQFQKSST